MNNKAIIYKQQIILDFYSNEMIDSAAISLKERWDLKHPDRPCLLLSFDMLKTKKPDLFQHYQPEFDVSLPTRIYIEGHGVPGCNKISSKYNDNSNSIDYQTLAERLARHIKDMPNVEINLLACGGGENSKSHHSFAVKLHSALTQILNRDVPVIARKSIVFLRSREDKKFIDKTTTDLDMSWKEAEAIKEKDSKHHQPGSKIIVTTNEHGQQVIIDGYFRNWRKLVLKKLEALRDHSKVVTMKSYLDTLLVEFHSLSNQEIYIKLTIEAIKPNANQNDNEQSSFFDNLFKNKDIKKELSKLIKEYERLMTSKHTTVEPMIVEKIKTKKF